MSTIMMNEKEMEQYLINNNYDIYTHDEENVIDSVLVIDIAVDLGFTPIIEQNETYSFSI